MEHAKGCAYMGQVIQNNNSTLIYVLSQETIRNNDGLVNWQTKIIAAHDKTFYLKHKKEKSNHVFETIMLGSEEECSNYVASITFRKPGQEQGNKIFAKFASQPRPIDLQSWGNVGLSLSGKALSNISTPKDDKVFKVFKCTLSIDKSELRISLQIACLSWDLRQCV